MGKSQFKKKAAAKARRHNPVRVPDAHLGNGISAAAEHVEKGKEQAMLPIMTKLHSADPADRTWACAAVTNLIANDPATRRLFQGKNIVGALIERLTDGVEDVVVESSGALRNLAIDAGHQLVSEMYNKNVLTPLFALLPRLKTTISKILTTPQTTIGEDGTEQKVVLDAKELVERKFCFPLAENVLMLFWCLSETSNKTLQALNASPILLPFLLAFLSHRSQIPQPVVLAAAQCLYALSCDNFPCTKNLRSGGEGTVEMLLSVLEDDGMTNGQNGKGKDKKGKKKAVGAEEGMEVDQDGEGSLVEQGTMIKVLIAGVLRNMSSPKKQVVPDLDTKYILPLIRPLLETDLNAIAVTVTETVPQLPDANALAQKIDKKLKTDHVTPAEQKLASIERRLATLMTALEVLTGICAGLKDEVAEEEEREEEMDDDEEEEEAMDMGNGNDEDDAMDMGGDEDGMDQNDEDDEDIPEEMEDLTDRKGKVLSSKSASTPLFGLVKLGLHTTLVAFGQVTSLSYPPAPDNDGRTEPSLHPPTTSFLSAIHLRAFEALNNLLLTVSAFAPTPSPPLPEQFASEEPHASPQWASLIAGHGSSLAAVWKESFTAAREAFASEAVKNVPGQEARVEVVDVIAGTWGALARIFAYGGLEIGTGDIESVISAYGAVDSETAKSRLISTLSTLGMRKGVTLEENRRIGEFLLTILGSLKNAQPASDEAVVAAVNGIIDMYADERSTYDVNFTQNGYLDAVINVEQSVTQMSKAVDKRKDMDLRARAEEAAENLSGFIQYRRALEQQAPRKAVES